MAACKLRAERNCSLIKSAAAARDQLPLRLEPLKMGVLIRDTTGSTQQSSRRWSLVVWYLWPWQMKVGSNGCCRLASRQRL